VADCPHGLDTRWCGVCLRGVAPKEPLVAIEARFAARYDGHCDGCNLSIHVGQRIARLSDDRYVHSPGCEPS